MDKGGQIIGVEASSLRVGVDVGMNISYFHELKESLDLMDIARSIILTIKIMKDDTTS